MSNAVKHTQRNADLSLFRPRIIILISASFSFGFLALNETGAFVPGPESRKIASHENSSVLFTIRLLKLTMVREAKEFEGSQGAQDGHGTSDRSPPF
jgi:hypothetical protein